jgi:hypothetical protein
LNLKLSGTGRLALPIPAPAGHHDIYTQAPTRKAPDPRLGNLPLAASLDSQARAWLAASVTVQLEARLGSATESPMPVFGFCRRQRHSRRACAGSWPPRHPPKPASEARVMACSWGAVTPGTAVDSSGVPVAGACDLDAELLSPRSARARSRRHWAPATRTRHQPELESRFKLALTPPCGNSKTITSYYYIYYLLKFLPFGLAATHRSRTAKIRREKSSFRTRTYRMSRQGRLNGAYA